MQSRKTSFPQLSTQTEWQWWRMRVLPPAAGRQITDAKDLRAEFTEPYDVQAAWDRAKSKRDPLLAPHGMFRNLKPGSNRHAIEFLEEFGALKPRSLPTDYISTGLPVRINLDEFWNYQSQFCQFAELYESRNDATRLAKALRTLIEHRPIHDVFRQLIDQVGRDYSGLRHWERFLQKNYGDSLKGMSVAELVRLAMIDEEEGRIDTVPPFIPLKAGMESQESDVLPGCVTEIVNMSFQAQRKQAMALLGSELNRHVGNRRVTWRREGDVWTLHVSSATSLWDMIWDLFAQDTSGTPWRICPHCQLIFYPIRADRFYCTTRQQTLASKRAYAQRVRAARQKKGRHGVTAETGPLTRA